MPKDRSARSTSKYAVDFDDYVERKPSEDSTFSHREAIVREKEKHLHPEDHAAIQVEYCTARARKGTGEGVCDAALDHHGVCPYASSHL